MVIVKLLKCRICLVENVRMHLVTNKKLHELYEKLTNIPFITEDSRPMFACFFCYTRLKQCYQLQRNCLEADKIFAQIINENGEKKPQLNQTLLGLSSFGGYIISPTVHVSCILDECQSLSEDIKEELPDDCEEYDDINDSTDEEEREPENLDQEGPPNYSESDSEDDTPLIEYTTGAKEVSKKNISRETQGASGAEKTELEDPIITRRKKTKQQSSTTTGGTQKPKSKRDDTIKSHKKSMSDRTHNNLNVKTRAEIVALHKDGYNTTDIARELGVAVSVFNVVLTIVRPTRSDTKGH